MGDTYIMLKTMYYSYLSYFNTFNAKTRIMVYVTFFNLLFSFNNVVWTTFSSELETLFFLTATEYFTEGGWSVTYWWTLRVFPVFLSYHKAGSTSVGHLYVEPQLSGFLCIGQSDQYCQIAYWKTASVYIQGDGVTQPRIIASTAVGFVGSSGLGLGGHTDLLRLI